MAAPFNRIHRGWRELVDKVTVPVRADLPVRVRTIGLPDIEDAQHIYTTDTATHGVYLLGEALWAYQSAGTQTDVLDHATAAYAALSGRDFKLLVADRPVNARHWALTYAPTAPDPAPGWLHHVETGARRQTQPDVALVETVVAISVSLCDVKKGIPVEGWREQHDEVLSQLSIEGLYARPAKAVDIAWLLHTATSPGLGTPPIMDTPYWGTDDMGEFGEGVEWEASPLARMVRVRSWRDGIEQSKWVAVLTAGRFSPRVMPGRTPPWISEALAVPFPVQVVVSGRFVAARDAVGEVEKRARWKNDEIGHLREHGREVPSSVLAVRDKAVALSDVLVNGDPLENARCEFVARWFVHGDTQAECMDRVRVLKKRYRDTVKVQLEHTVDQVAGLGEFQLGRKEISFGYRRHAPVALLAGGVPNVTGRIGQTFSEYPPSRYNGGVLPAPMFFGYTSGERPRRAVLHDPWYPMEGRDDVGIYPVLGDPGAGRSTFGLRLMVEAGLMGAHVVALDPAGEWANLDQLTCLAGRVQIVNIASNSTPGMLAPHRVLPDPDRDAYDSDIEWRNECEITRSTRHDILLDAIKSLIDRETWQDPTARKAIKDGCRQANGNPWSLVAYLADTARGNQPDLADELTSAAAGHARILFPPLYEDSSVLTSLYDANVVVITLHGMNFPAPGSSEENWTTEQRTGAVMLRLAAFLTRQLVLRPNLKRARKLLYIDEAHWLGNWEQGQDFVAGLVRHIRRWNLALYLATQHPEDLAKLDPNGKTFVCGGFVGRTADLDVAARSLSLVRLAPGYESVARVLSQTSNTERTPGEFLHVDALRRGERVRLDVEAFPEIYRQSNTTPGKINA